jgi:hypothetical protein
VRKCDDFTLRFLSFVPKKKCFKIKNVTYR